MRLTNSGAIVAAAACIFVLLPASSVLAERVSESTVERVCGDKIQGGCAGSTCATGCEKTENGTLYTYGCTFPNKTGATKATCTRTPIGRIGQSQIEGEAVGEKPLILRKRAD